MVHSQVLSATAVLIKLSAYSDRLAKHSSLIPDDMASVNMSLADDGGNNSISAMGKAAARE